MTKLIITGAGDSHGVSYTGIIQGLPSNLEITLAEIQADLNKRKPGGTYATSRQEADLLEITSGYYQGKTTGAPLAFNIKNQNQISADYDLLETYLRPGHADFVREFKYSHFDHRGSGHFSARFTLIDVVAGSFAKKILAQNNIYVEGYVSQIGILKDERNYDHIDMNLRETSQLRMLDPKLCLEAKSYLDSIIEKKMSIGSKATLQVRGLPIGLGTPHSDKLNAKVAYALFSLPAVQAVSFGNAELALTSYGHNFHDQIASLSKDKIQFASNNHGGVLGGMSSGAPLVVHTILKPPSSFGHAQTYWNKKLQKNETLELPGRFDPVLAPRFIPVAEAKLALTILDALDRLRD